MTYRPLPIKTVPVDALQLDLDNYRIPTRSHDEAAALHYLFASEDVIDQAKLILRNGYFDNELPIVTAHGAGFVVLEGNRRVSALKALRKPDLVPDHAQAVRALLTRYAPEVADLPASIRVIVAKSRDDAAPHIARLHSGNPKKRWSLDQQANYYYSLLDHRSADDVKASYSDVTVSRFFKMAAMRRFLTGVKYKDRSLIAYVSSDELTMSAFEYAYRNAGIAAAIGAHFDRDGLLEPRTLSPDKIGAALAAHQRDAVEYLMNEFRAKRLDTRSTAFKKDTPQLADLLAQLTGQQTPDATAENRDPEPTGAAVTADSDEDDDNSTHAGSPPPTTDSSAAPGITPPPGTRGPNHPDTKDTLQLTALDFSDAPLNLQLRYHELDRISLSRTPCAAAMLLRSVLETTIKFRFESASPPASGKLSDCFPHVDQAYGSEKALKPTINTVKTGRGDKPGTLNWFNLVPHTVDMPVTAHDVREAFKLVSPILRRLLRPLTTP